MYLIKFPQSALNHIHLPYLPSALLVYISITCHESWYGHKMSHIYNLPWNISIILLSTIILEHIHLSYFIFTRHVILCILFYYKLIRVQIFYDKPTTVLSSAEIYTLWYFSMKKTSRTRITVYVVFKSLINWEIERGGGCSHFPVRPCPIWTEI